ncbi:17467_t:CDS:2 [Dentiscutata erythropus]|uniref:17467_t:CDS:1 n=1 Tax=Dentiscutata erythropus TaxID=1348616 RepID=A0A9N9BAP4_9GLOM|nr:17467_t:CDS:2 [Dentiscutata erythropus]
MKKTRFNNLLYDITERQIRAETNRETLVNEEHYDLIIQSLVEFVFKPPRTIQTLQNLRQELYNKITQSSYRIKKIKNLKEAFDWLIDLLEKKEKIYNLFNEIIINYIEEKYFNNEIDKIDEKTCLYKKQFLQNLKEQIYEMYNNEEKDYYFIDLKGDIDMFNKNITDFIDKTIKKNIIYKLIKEIYQENKDTPDPKRRNKRIMKPEKEYNKESIPFVHSILVKWEFIEDVSPLTISAIFDIYKEVVNTSDEEIKNLKTIIINNLDNYLDILWSIAYSLALATSIDFYKKAKARYFTKQHFLDIVMSELNKGSILSEVECINNLIKQYEEKLVKKGNRNIKSSKTCYS